MISWWHYPFMVLYLNLFYKKKNNRDITALKVSLECLSNNNKIKLYIIFLVTCFQFFPTYQWNYQIISLKLFFWSSLVYKQTRVSSKWIPRFNFRLALNECMEIIYTRIANIMQTVKQANFVEIRYGCCVKCIHNIMCSIEG